MKFHETEFARQLAIVVLGALLAVFSVAFLWVPGSTECAPASADRCVASTMHGHLT